MVVSPSMTGVEQTRTRRALQSTSDRHPCSIGSPRMSWSAGRGPSARSAQTLVSCHDLDRGRREQLEGTRSVVTRAWVSASTASKHEPSGRRLELIVRARGRAARRCRRPPASRRHARQRIADSARARRNAIRSRVRPAVVHAQAGLLATRARHGSPAAVTPMPPGSARRTRHACAAEFVLRRFDRQQVTVLHMLVHVARTPRPSSSRRTAITYSCGASVAPSSVDRLISE